MKRRAKLLGLAAVLACVLVPLVLVLLALRDGGEAGAARAVERLGGNVIRDPNAAGQPVVSVELGNTPVQDADLKLLREFPHLRALHLVGTDVTDAGMREVGELRSLRTLNLRRTRVTDAGLKELRGLTELRELDLADTPVTDAGVADLRTALPGLRVSR